MNIAAVPKSLRRFKNDKIFLSTLLGIAVPIALQNLIASSVNMLDTVMVGRLGAGALAAVGLGNQVYFLLVIMLFGTGTGAGVFIAQFWGKKDVPGIRRATGLALCFGAALSFAFLAVCSVFPRFVLGLYTTDQDVLALGSRYLRLAAWSYPAVAVSFLFSLALRGVEKVKLPLAATTVSLATNAALNYMLIFGKLGLPALGVEGAAIATIVSRWLEAALVLAGSYLRGYPPAGRIREYVDWNKAYVSRFVRIALPVLLNETAWSLGITFYSGIFARISTQALAAYNIQATIGELIQVFALGTANAAAVMLGKRIGEGNRGSAYEWADRFAAIGLALGVAMGLALAPVSSILPGIFRMESTVLDEASAMVLCLAATYPVRVFNLHLVVGICRSGGDTRFGFFFDLFGVWGVGIPLALLGAFVWRLPSWLVFLLTGGDELAKFGLGIWRLKSRKWLRDVTS